ncbi:hypothetical protein AJ78_00336 [Emergomyces pasteurianus Ep9510]|uniref:Uncharacterized protein n=1 Tax=Emergomyces pasteurianus Ep9510 TaxID=1447872 RepID=A0A1J9PTI5_9EURO|nr:hypothetical protein AJ78_00336 [Emergomyces pasteurianus Ep9510]
MDGSPRRVVEAKSHLPLITLASNPPRYPRNPSKALLKPLVLYIVRVPGSRDVFLSPLKPPTESSISPALIEAALYYIHVATPDDEAVLQAIEEEKRLNETLLGAKRNPSPGGPSTRVHRKPVPGADVQPMELKPPSIPRRPVSSDANIPFQTGAGNGSHQFRNPWAPEVQTNDSPDLQRNPTFSRKPLPPVPADPKDHLFPPAAMNSANLRTGYGQPRLDTPPVNPLGRKEYLTPPSDHHLQRGPRGRASWDGGRPSILTEPGPVPGPLQGIKSGRRSVERGREPPPPFHLTLIRRDTTNGIQWNVGKITNCISQSSPDVALDGTITIEILTLGYKTLAAEKMPLSAPRANPTHTHPDAADGSDNSIKFIRYLTLTSPQNSRHGQHSSISSINSLSSLEQTAAKDHPSSKPPRGSHYTFKSPWDGTCTFVTGINGRSLKCKHTIPPPTSHASLAGLNLPNVTNSTSSDTPQPHLNLQKLQSALEASAAAASQSSSPAANGSTATAAELRFNLPIFSTHHKGQHHHSSSHGHQYEKNAAHAPNSPGNSHARFSKAKLRSQAEELAGHLDLSLGRERAGGGTFGKSAKLGKLIIEDEGLKMLDLVVAACMGVWWGVYDTLS